MDEANTVQIQETETYGALLAVAHDQFGTRTRYWFDIEGPDAIHAQEVVYVTEKERYVVPKDNMSVPTRVNEAVRSEGYTVKGVDHV